MPYVRIAGKALFYTVGQGAREQRSEGAGGQKHALLLIHGAGGSRLLWPGELRRLPGATVYTLDLPGHGRSEGHGRDTIGGYTEDVVAFLGAVGVEQAVVVGHSMGGAIALTLALDDADRVTGLVLIASGARLRVAPAVLEGICRNFEVAVELLNRSAWSPDAPPALVEAGRRALLATNPDVFLGDFTACDRFDVMGRLEEIGVPTLAIAGSADLLTPARYARFLAEHIAGARCVILEGAGHMVMLERPAGTAEAMQGFLAGTL